MNQEEAPPNDLSPDAYVLSEVVKPLMQSFNEILELYSDIKRKYAEHCKDCENHQKSDVKANLDLETSVIAEVAPSDNFMKITDFNKLKAQLTRIMGHMKQLDDEYQSGKEQNEQAILQTVIMKIKYFFNNYSFPVVLNIQCHNLRSYIKEVNKKIGNVAIVSVSLFVIIIIVFLAYQLL